MQSGIGAHRVGGVVEDVGVRRRGEGGGQRGRPLGQAELVLADQCGRVDHREVEGPLAHQQLLLAGVRTAHPTQLKSIVRHAHQTKCKNQCMCKTVLR